MEDLKYWIWLSRIENVGSIKLQKLLQKFNTPFGIWNASKKELLQIDGIGEETAKQILKVEYRDNLEKYENYMKKNNIELIHIYDKYYYIKLKEIFDKPIVLYVKGNKQILNDFSLAIIGCREHTDYGKNVADKLSYDIAKLEIVTVSGLARGIDSIAHKATLRTPSWIVL